MTRGPLSPTQLEQAIASLSERQRVALRMTARGHESKTIAPVVERSRFTIDKDLEKAMAILGARDRHEAARWLVDHEADRYEPFVYEPQALPPPQQSGNLIGSEAMQHPPPGSRVGEERAQFAFSDIGHDSGGMRQPGETEQGRNRLPGWQLIALAIAGAIAVVVMLAGMLAVSGGLQTLFVRAFS